MQQLENFPCRRVNSRQASSLTKRTLAARPPSEIQRTHLQNRYAAGALALAQFPIHLHFQGAARQLDTNRHQPNPHCAAQQLESFRRGRVNSRSLTISGVISATDSRRVRVAGSGSLFWRAPRRRHAARPPDDEVLSDLPDRDFALLLAAAKLVPFLDLQRPARKPDPYCHVPSRTLCPTRYERFMGAVSSRLSNFA